MSFNNQTFTKRSTIMETVTLELDPIGRTRETFDENGILEFDEAMHKRVKEIAQKRVKPYLVNVANEAICALQSEFIKENENSSKAKEKENISKTVKDALSKGFKGMDITSATWFKGKLPKQLISIGDHEAAADIDSLHDYFGYISLLLTNYKTSIFTLIPKRAAENKEIFINNIPKFQAAIKRGSEFAKENEEFLSLCASEDAYYTHFLSMEGIALYNTFISGVNSENGIEKLGFNGFVSQENTRIKNDGNTKESTYKPAKRLKKFILTAPVKMYKVGIVNNNNDAIDLFRQHIEVMGPLCEEIESFFEEITDDTLVVRNKLGYLSKLVFADYSVLESLDVNTESIKDYSDASGENIKEFLGSYIAEKSDYLNYLYEKIEGSGLYESEQFKKDENLKSLVNKYIDTVSDISSLVSIFACEEDNASAFNIQCIEYRGLLGANHSVGRKLRGYITRSFKQESTLVRTALGSPSKLNDFRWCKSVDDSLRTNSLAFILYKDKLYLLSATNKTIKFKEPSSEEDTAYLCYFKKARGSYLNIPKLVFSSAVKSFFESGDGDTFVNKVGFSDKPLAITKEQYEIYKNGTFKSKAVKDDGLTEEEVRKNAVKLMALYIKAVKQADEYSDFDLSSLKNPSDYASIGQLNSTIDALSIYAEKQPLSYSAIMDLVEDKKAYFFMITANHMYDDNQNGSGYGKKFKNLFSDENLKKPTMFPGSNPAIYFRKKLFSKEITHPLGSMLVNKRTEDGRSVPKDVYEQLYLYHNNMLMKEELSDRTLEYLPKVQFKENVYHDMSRKESYARDMFKFSISIITNKDVEIDSTFSLDEDIKSEFENNGKYLTLLRGKEHLLYYVLFDKDGKILESKSLNEIDGSNFYNQLKDITREKRISQKRYEYDLSAENIKDAYIKKACSVIAKLAIEHNAIVLIDTVSEHERSKSCALDAQIYGKFKDALVRKFSKLTFRNVKEGLPGSISNPLQLSYDSLSWRKGILYEINYAYLRNMDAKTGFANFFDLSEIDTLKSIQAFFEKFEEIKLTDDEISFKFDYKNFETVIESPVKQWTVKMDNSTYRDFYNSKEGKVEFYDMPVLHVKQLLKECGVNVENEDILSEIPNFNKKAALILFEIFKRISYGTSLTKDSDNRRFISPVTGEIVEDLYDYWAKLMLKKYEYSEQYLEDKKNNSKIANKEKAYSYGWLHLLQNCKDSDIYGLEREDSKPKKKKK